MANARRSRRPRVNVFNIGEAYLFKHYFDDEAVYERLKPHYNHRQYRFQIPADEFDEIRDFLEDHGYELTVIEDVGDYVVVVEKYSDHPDNILKRSIMQGSVPDYNYFLMNSKSAVEEMVYAGAERIENTDLEIRLRE